MKPSDRIDDEAAGRATVRPAGTPGLEIASGASASLVNRTHRVVRERARNLQARRSVMRGLFLPMLLSSALMLMLLFAVWSVLGQYDLVSAELPVASNHFAVLLLWFLPVSAALVAMIWYRRGQSQTDGETTR